MYVPLLAISQIVTTKKKQKDNIRSNMYVRFWFFYIIISYFLKNQLKLICGIVGNLSEAVDSLSSRFEVRFKV